jgi:hypothetical protein
MTIGDLTTKEGPEISLVQNRLTVAGLSLTTLFFSGSFSLALYGLLRQDATPEYRIEFAHIEGALALGALGGFLTIGSLLLCQQLNDPKARWFAARRWWFCVGTIWLYVTLAQAMSAGMSEVVYGVALFHRGVGTFLGLLCTLVWWLLLFGAPIHLLRRSRQVITLPEHRALLIAYVATLLSVILASGEIYRHRGSEPSTLSAFLSNVFLQLVQPVTWAYPWPW